MLRFHVDSTELAHRIAEAIVEREIQLPKEIVSLVGKLRNQKVQQYLQAATEAEEYVMFHEDFESGLEPGLVQKVVGLTLIGLSVALITLVALGPRVREAQAEDRKESDLRRAGQIITPTTPAPLVAPQI